MKANHVLIAILLTLVSVSAHALERKVFCIWDPVGRNGPVMSFYSDLIPKAQSWGLNIRFVAYTDEKVAASDFKAGRCEAVLLSAILSRQFVKFGGTMDAIGAITSQKGLELVIGTLARPRAGKLMTQGNYEVVATFPVGSMFAFVNDRAIKSIDDFAGKKLAILNGDPQAKKFADLAGASPFNVTLTTFAGQFNNGNVDILLMPALAYNTFELYNGLADKGGIINYRLYYGMLQTIAKRDKFSDICTTSRKTGKKECVSFGHKMRRYILSRMNDMEKMVSDAEKEIPAKYWIDVSQFTKDDIDHFSKRVRMELKRDKVNHPTALKLLWKIRCRLDRSRGECTANAKPE
jgi:Solute-binding protein AdeT 1/2